MQRPMTDEQRDNLFTIWTLCRANGGSTRLDSLRSQARAFVKRGFVLKLEGGGLQRWAMTPAGDAFGVAEAAARAERRNIRNANRGDAAMVEVAQ